MIHVLKVHETVRDVTFTHCAAASQINNRLFLRQRISDNFRTAIAGYVKKPPSPQVIETHHSSHQKLGQPRRSFLSGSSTIDRVHPRWVSAITVSSARRNFPRSNAVNYQNLTRQQTLLRRTAQERTIVRTRKMLAMGMMNQRSGDSSRGVEIVTHHRAATPAMAWWRLGTANLRGPSSRRRLRLQIGRRPLR